MVVQVQAITMHCNAAFVRCRTVEQFFFAVDHLAERHLHAVGEDLAAVADAVPGVDVDG